MLASVSTRKLAWVGEPVDEAVEEEAETRKKGSVAEELIKRPPTDLEKLGRRLDAARLGVMTLDGLDVAKRTHVLALWISTGGVKIPLGQREGSTERGPSACRPR